LACDVAIVGGGIIGSAIAYFLCGRDPTLRVSVIEPDPSYEFASTPRASGGARVQFSCPENIAMSLFSLDFIRAFEEPVDWVEGGYLLIARPGEEAKLLESNHRIQLAHGCEAILLDAAGLKQRWPSMNVEDLAAGVHTPRDGWCDPNSLLQGLRRRAVKAGATYVKDRVVAFDRDGSVVRAARLESGGTIAASQFVNAAGAWAGVVGEMAGMPTPISPLRRFEHFFTPQEPMERLPYVKDFQRMAFRSEGRGFSGGVVDGEEPRGFNFEVDHDYFERAVWPAAAHRFPPLEAAKCQRTWAGLYEQCELDGNPIFGNWPGRLDNFHLCAGFSGHGMMHAPAAGRAMAELILDGRYMTIDLRRLGYQRVQDAIPYAETGIK